MPGSEPPYASRDDAGTRRLRRSPPPETALRWVEAAAGVAVEGWVALRGGTSSAMYALELVGAGPTKLVLRCHLRPEQADEAPVTVARESAALRTVAAIDVPTPELVAHDATGAHAGVPCVVMTWLPGRPEWGPAELAGGLARLAAALPALHTAATDDDLGRYATYRQDSDEPPPWATDPRTWERAIEVFHGPVLDAERSFIHRDLHPGNVLWRRRRISGVVDWASACVGPPSVDVGHCRANLLGYAPELADRYTALAERATGRAFHPWADIAALIGMLEGLRHHPPRRASRDAIERALGRAVASCA